MIRTFVIALLFIIVVVGAIGVLRPDIFRSLIGDGDSQNFAQACLKSAGSDTQFGAGISPDGNSVSMNLGAKEILEGGKDAASLKLIVECIRSAYSKAGIKNDYHTTSTVPLGLVADQWAGGEPALTLLQTSDQQSNKYLQNIAFGPASGLRSSLIELWCGENTGCVECSPNLGAESLADATTVSVRLKSGATFEKLNFGIAPLASDGKHPFQIVESAEGLDEGLGNRVGYICAN